MICGSLRTRAILVAQDRGARPTTDPSEMENLMAQDSPIEMYAVAVYSDSEGWTIRDGDYFHSEIHALAWVDRTLKGWPISERPTLVETPVRAVKIVSI